MADRKMIYLDDAIDAIKALWDGAPTAQHVSAMFDCEDVIQALPSAQPVRKTGQWIKRKKGAIGYNCSCCGKSDISNHFDYCPNCGADMKGDRDEQE